jgi:AraC-like DNA-binding protein
MVERRSGLEWSEEAVTCLLTCGSKGLARRSGVSVRTLRRRLRRSGITLKEITLAKRAAVVLNLMQAGLPLGTIAARVGLSSSPALTRFVRHEFGTTPLRLAVQLRISERSHEGLG